MKNRAYILAAAFLFIAFIMHVLGDVYYLYTRITWYDDPLHFISGLGLGLTFYWLFAEFNILGGLRGNNLWAIVGLVLVAGTVWECFEAFYDLAGYPIGSVAYCVDTVKDVLNGVVGSVAALIIVKETFEKKNKVIRN
jgi:hypothetical protein